MKNSSDIPIIENCGEYNIIKWTYIQQLFIVYKTCLDGSRLKKKKRFPGCLEKKNFDEQIK